MASDLNELADLLCKPGGLRHLKEQGKQIKDIVDIGRKLVLSGLLIETAILIANAESDFDPNPKNPDSTAKRLFQYLDGSWVTTWNKYMASCSL